MSPNRTTSSPRPSFDDKSEARRQDSFGSDFSIQTKGSPTFAPSSWFKRTGSNDSDQKPNFGTVNRYTHCGRHTDQFLFGGHSISDSIKDLMRKKE
ncbi:hypothetical protein F4777DRAFT_546953 [Nemania sp. FL0916]|nr:hypothetical protein F4777DRAFT_546953 [Nemania sp. FL0916]